MKKGYSSNTDMPKILFGKFDFSLLDSPDFKEDSVREEIISPILQKLGYSSSGKAKIIRSKKLTHPFVKLGTRKEQITNFPDYLFQIEKKYAWVLDAKGPNEAINSGDNKQQTFFYAIHPEIQVAYYSLCNGREFTVFRIDQDEPILTFQVSDIDFAWEHLERLLSPKVFHPKIAESIVKSIKTEDSAFDYPSQKILPELPVKKQQAKRHFGVHGYFTKQAWNVVQEYIKNFTKPGDIVLDPFGGSGVTLVEALMTGRKGTNIDLNPLAVFLVKTLIRPVNLNELRNQFAKVVLEFDKNCPKTENEINKALKTYPYPKGHKLPKGSDVDVVEKLFNKRQLAQLAYLKHLISKIKDEAIRDCLMLSFSSSLTMFNLTYHSSKTRGDMGGDTAAFRYYRYRIAPKGVELELMPIFKNKVQKVINAKHEMQPIINAKIVNDAHVIQGSATDLKGITNESIDYIYTDPPYGSKIPYLDLSTMWNAWLDLEVTEEDYDQEAIEGGEHHKTKDDYSDLLSISIKEMFRVLKYDRWMSFVFAHQDPAYWHLIVDTAEKAGFEYAGAVKQRTSQQSFKKRQNPFTVLSGQLIINFRKVKNPDTIMKVALGADIMDIIFETIEGTIAKYDGATIEEINDELIVKGLELGFLDVLSKEYKDIAPLVRAHYDYDDETNKYHLAPDTKFKTKIDEELRIRYFLLSYLKRMQIEKKSPTFDEIILHIMPLLKNGTTPEEQTILKVLEEIGERVEKGCWSLKIKGQMSLLAEHSIQSVPSPQTSARRTS